MSDDRVREELAAALEVALDAAYHYSSYRWPQQQDCPRIADALLPTVRRIVAEAVAGELEAEAAYDDAAPEEQYARGLFARRLRVRAANALADALSAPRSDEQGAPGVPGTPHAGNEAHRANGGVA